MDRTYPCTSRAAGLGGWLVVWLFALAVSNYSGTSGAADSPTTVDYLQQVKPLLANHCYACHGALKQAGGLRLDTVELAVRGGDSGPAIIAGQPEQSLLMERVSAADPASRMPPEGKPLSSEQIQLLTQWLRDGATAPPGEVPEADPLTHWAYVRPVQRLPDARAHDLSSITHPIDMWLAVAQNRLAVQPLPPADKRQLLRRVTLDLVGVPPTIAEMDRFLLDNSPDAYERVVDGLLGRPEYGQRWGRHWMDVWRYSDWYGRRAVPDVMNSYPQIWRWRDWIVRSLNEDKGYDQMVMQMLAGDELNPTDQQNIVATGFIVRNWYKWNYETWMKDSVEHTGKAFLGLTLNCAMCHDHKYEPITHEDYFRFRAFFEPLELQHERVAGQPDPGPFKKYVYAQSYGPITSGAIRVFDEKLDAQTFMFSGGDARNRIADRPPVDCGPPRFLSGERFAIEPVQLPPEAAYPGLKDFVRQEERAKLAQQRQRAADKVVASKAALQQATDHSLTVQSAARGPATAANYPAAGAQLAAQRAVADAQKQERLDRLSLEIAEAHCDSLERRIAADDATYRTGQAIAEASQVAALSEKQVAYLNAQHAALAAEWAAELAERQQQAVAEKADELEKARQAVASANQNLTAARAAVDAARAKLAQLDANYTPLSPKYPAQSTGRRTALARWLVHPDNPLVARVAVNHIWLRHFGKPLVESVDNFGIQGQTPEHPELLDWLAVELMRRNWSMKAIHRLIVTSAAYRRSSPIGSPNQPNLNHDRDNRSFWFYPPQRMQAEVVRDSLLACAGALDRSFDGPELPAEDNLKLPRRGMYFTQHGEALMPFLSTFDAANVCECYRRTSTVMPAQALALTNSEFVIHYSRLCAARLSELVKSTAKTEDKIVDASSNLVDASSNLVALSSNLVDPSSNLVDPSSNEVFVQLAFQTILNRPGSADELRAALEFMEQLQRAALQGDLQSDLSAQSINANGLQPPGSDSGQRARENLVMALFNHNDFVTIR